MELTRQRSINRSFLEQFTKECKINIVLEKEGEAQWPISIKDTLNQNVHDEIMLNEILLKLKRQNFTDFFEASVSYYHHQKKLYIFCCYLPKNITERELENEPKYNKRISSAALDIRGPQNYLKLKFRKKVKTKIELLKEEQREKYIEYEEEPRKSTKQKEKTIGEVIEKVALWRKFYTGFPDEKGQITHMELDNAATEIGVVKKTLDDYLLQIRNGKRYGFNFQKHREDKIGDLRSFVREKKETKQK